MSNDLLKTIAAGTTATGTFASSGTDVNGIHTAQEAGNEARVACLFRERYSCERRDAWREWFESSSRRTASVYTRCQRPALQRGVFREWS